MLKGFVNPADATDCNCDISPIAPCTEIVNWFKGATQKASSGPGALAWEPGAWVCYWPWYSHHLEQVSLFGTPDLSLIYKLRGWTVQFLGSFQLQHSLTPWKYSVQNLPLLLLFSLQWTLHSFYYPHCVSGQGQWDLEHKASPGRMSWIVFTWHRCPNQAQETWVLGRTENEYLEARESHQWNPNRSISAQLTGLHLFHIHTCRCLFPPLPGAPVSAPLIHPGGLFCLYLSLSFPWTPLTLTAPEDTIPFFPGTVMCSGVRRETRKRWGLNQRREGRGRITLERSLAHPQAPVLPLEGLRHIWHRKTGRQTGRQRAPLKDKSRGQTNWKYVQYFNFFSKCYFK